MDFDLFGLYFGAFTACFFSFLLGQIDLKVIREMVNERDRSVPVRWLGGREEKAWAGGAYVVFAAILYMIILPQDIHWMIFFLSLFVVGVVMFLTYILLNLDYRLPPSPEGEVTTLLDRQRGHSHRAR
jgi:hypothetical protein